MARIFNRTRADTVITDMGGIRAGKDAVEIFGEAIKIEVAMAID
jgi:hypothetical protein